MEPQVIAAVIAGFFGSVLGSITALARFKGERSFDRQLDWYERAVRALFEMSQNIEVAITHHEEGRNPELIDSRWRDVQKSHLQVDRLTVEANIYGSALALVTMKEINDKIQEVAEATNAFDPETIDISKRPEAIKLIDTLPSKLLDAAQPLAAEARNHLSIT